MGGRGRAQWTDLQARGDVMATSETGGSDDLRKPGGAEHSVVPAGTEGGRSEGGGVRVTGSEAMGSSHPGGAGSLQTRCGSMPLSAGCVGTEGLMGDSGDWVAGVVEGWKIG